jgi:transcription initiation factor TFIIIB Brf1 subunit/transcription initiation factor TFIIB
MLRFTERRHGTPRSLLSIARRRQAVVGISNRLGVSAFTKEIEEVVERTRRAGVLTEIVVAAGTVFVARRHNIDLRTRDSARILDADYRAVNRVLCRRIVRELGHGLLPTLTAEAYLVFASRRLGLSTEAWTWTLSAAEAIRNEPTRSTPRTTAVYFIGYLHQSRPDLVPKTLAEIAKAVGTSEIAFRFVRRLLLRNVERQLPPLPP